MGASVFVCVGDIEVGEGLSWVESGVDERSFCIDEKSAGIDHPAPQELIICEVIQGYQKPYVDFLLQRCATENGS